MTGWKRTLTELLAGIVLSGIVFEVIGLIFVKDKLSHFIGMLIGIFIALAMATHMAFSLNDALDWDEENAKKAIWKSYLIRYIAVAVCMGLVAYFKIGDIISCFCGIMSLKAAAYLQPHLHRFVNKYILKIKEEGGCVDGIIDAEDDFGDWTECGFYDSWSDRI
jgi:uncharacterized membrane protein YidH (DUF202 family)